MQTRGFPVQQSQTKTLGGGAVPLKPSRSSAECGSQPRFSMGDNKLGRHGADGAGRWLSELRVLNCASVRIWGQIPKSHRKAQCGHVCL